MTEPFIQKAREMHGDKYDYCKTVYENNLKEVIIICKEHGEFLQLPKTHKRGNGCKDCGKNTRSLKRSSNTVDFIKKASDIHGNLYDYSKVEYKKAIEKVIIICKKHGEFNQTPNGHLDGKGCRKCSDKKASDRIRSNTEEFIEKAREIHGTNFNYDNVDYIDANTPLIIKCKEGHIFYQTANSHLSGSGCKFCSGVYQSNTEEFIKKAREIHGNLYGYDQVKYKNAMTKVKIMCNIHGIFEMKPNGHLSAGYGCQKCGHNMTIFNTNDFIEKAREIHQNNYDYSESNYVNMTTFVNIMCKKGHLFIQTPSNHITHKQGCQTCAGNYKSNTEEFIQKSILHHGLKYNYEKVNYINNHTNITIICQEHGEFIQTPASHLSNGYGCQTCANYYRRINQSSNIENFIQKARETHSDKYNYSKVNYVNARTKVIIICQEHGEFTQIPDSHLRGCGCPKCSPRGYSKKAIEYLTFMSNINGIHIQHAENDGEYKIPNTRWSADGYCVETNTIYEFHGTEYHGDPRCCDPDECNYLDKNYGELYQNTKEREKVIESMGYNLIVMWEYDWDKIIKSVKMVQRKFRMRLSL